MVGQFVGWMDGMGWNVWNDTLHAADSNSGKAQARSERRDFVGCDVGNQVSAFSWEVLVPREMDD